MARTISQIFSLAKQDFGERIGRLEKPPGIANSSKFSVVDALLWAASAGIWAFENILDVFKTDMEKDVFTHINGTVGYYAAALKKYQKGWELKSDEDGVQFWYPEQDESARIIKHVSITEVSAPGYFDRDLVAKIATGEDGEYEPIEENDLADINDYMHQLAFAGTHITILSRGGDVLVPRLTVYHDGGVSAASLKESVVQAIHDYTTSRGFDDMIYIQHIVDAVQAVPHVKDVYFDPSLDQGIYYSGYSDVTEELMPLKKVERYFRPSSGYLIEARGTESAAGVKYSFPKWSECIVVREEDRV